MLIFRPAISRSGTLTELPLPILSCRLHDAWDFQKLKVPRRDGDLIAGVSQDGVDVRFEGQIGSVSGDVKLSEEQMLDALEQLRTALQPGDDDSGYKLILFQSVAGLCRTLHDCTTSRFDIDLSSKHIFAYSLAIHAADPRLHVEHLA